MNQSMILVGSSFFQFYRRAMAVIHVIATNFRSKKSTITFNELLCFSFRGLTHCRIICLLVLH